MNNAAQSLSYFIVVQNPVLADLGMTLTMMIVVAILHYKKELDVFAKYFAKNP